ncbi:MAG: tyrosine-type recombinase/integrase [Candidatus Nitrosopumilus sp. bin_68KS]
MRAKTLTIDYDWEEYSAIKKWKMSLTKKSIKGELSQSTWKSSTYWMKKILISSGLNPHNLVSEALENPEHGEDRLYECFEWCKKHNQNHNSAIIGVYGVLRGFYSHNNVDTRRWSSPKMQPRQVMQTDAGYALFRTNDTTKKLELDMTLVRSFLKKLSFRDETIAVCLFSSGLDIGDLAKIDLSFVAGQQKSQRLFLSGYREKNGEWIKTFFSREATSMLRKYVLEERLDAADSEPIFVTSKKERKRQFKKEHGRRFASDGIDTLPRGRRIDTRVVATNFRKAQELLGIQLQNGIQAPLRPKRFRHGFRQACQHAGLQDDMARVFMGQKGMSSKTYQSKSREELETFYEMVEPYVTVYSDLKASDIEKEFEKREKQQTKLHEQKIAEMEEMMHEMQKEMVLQRSSIALHNAMRGIPTVVDLKQLESQSNRKPEALSWKPLLHNFTD